MVAGKGDTARNAEAEAEEAEDDRNADGVAPSSGAALPSPPPDTASPPTTAAAESVVVVVDYYYYYSAFLVALNQSRRYSIAS